ncbi:hypothetical protein [Taibaiella chishuiensis]|uniref:Uncharacterized protein n=1 Tax=Taibaiella chishuiensis TaxID=1434707 RepID=A0A2P8D8J2_9BACT|nr:hypothetical protein [Taibaiella chishuiensis]PSK93529.1 hypothetical protein B0I18_102499 [Taibaiella chishuiensis]
MKQTTDYLPLAFLLITACLFLLVFGRRRQKAAQKKGSLSTRPQLPPIPPEAHAGKWTEVDVLECAVAAGLPDGIIRLLGARCDDPVLQQHRLHKDYACPYAITDLTKREQEVYAIDRFKPILAYAHATIFAYDTLKKGYVTYDIESEPDVAAGCLTWDGVFVSEILRWWEYEIPDADIIYIGHYFGLHYTEQVLQSIYARTDGKGFPTYKALNAWEQEMLAEIKGVIA